MSSPVPPAWQADAVIEVALATSGMSPARYAIVRCVAHHPAGITRAQVAARTGLKPLLVLRHLNPLIASGAVRRVPTVPRQGATVVYYPTPQLTASMDALSRSLHPPSR